MPLSSCLFLSATDTTIGFLSQDSHRIDRVKKRPKSMPYIRVFPSFQALKAQRLRIPYKHRRSVRRARKISYILPNAQSFRIVHDPRHLLLLKRLGWAYSSSANLSAHPYDEAYARSVADVVIEPLSPSSPPSQILRLGKHSCRRIR